MKFFQKLKSKEENEHLNFEETSQGLMPSNIYKAFEMEKSIEICVALLDQTLDATRCFTPNGGTILHLAAYYIGGFDVCWLVPSEILMMKDDNDDTALSIASREGNLAFVEDLIEEVKRKVSNGVEEEGQSAQPYVRLLEMQNKQGNASLHEAVVGNHLEVVQYLIEIEPLANYACNAFGECPLFLAIERGYFEVAKKIMEKLSTVDFSGPGGSCVLHIAVMYDMQDVIVELVQYNKDLLYWKDVQGWVALHYATIQRNLKMAKKLIEYDRCLIYMKDNRGFTPLIVAVSLGYVDLVELFLHYAPDCCQSVDTLNRNALHIAAFYGQSKVLEYLLTLKGNQSLVNQRDLEGNTPLHLSISRQNNLPSLITNDRVDLCARNLQQLTAMDLLDPFPSHFLLRGRKAIYKTLLKAGGRLSTLRVQEKYRNNVVSLESGLVEEECDTHKKASIHILVAILVATISFPALYSVYAAYNNNEKHSKLKTVSFYGFIGSNGIAMLTSVAAIIVYLFMSHSAYPLTFLLDKKHLSLATALTIASVGAMDIAFATASMAVFPLVPGIVAAVFSIPFFILYLAFVKKLFRF